MLLLCDRPLFQDLNLETSRFVVCKISGLDVNGKHLQMGDEIPQGALKSDVLRQVYEPPLHLIETIEFAYKDPGLEEACARQGVLLTKPEPPVTQPKAPVTSAKWNKSKPRR